MCVGARTYGMDCLRQARALTLADPMWARRCSAEAASMMRKSRQARSLLLRLQTVREKRETDSAATDRAAWSEHCSIGLMTNALAEAPPEPPPPRTRAARTRAGGGGGRATSPLPASIRSRRPARQPDFGPPDPDLIHAIVTGTTPELRALDAEAPQQAVT